jgi:hypothetical protein
LKDNTVGKPVKPVKPEQPVQHVMQIELVTLNLKLIHPLSTSHFKLLFTFPVLPPQITEGPNEEIRHSEHIEDATVESFAGGTTGLEIGFNGHAAHGALRTGFCAEGDIQQESQADDA